MKKWIVLLLIAALLLSGCQIVIINPFVTAPSAEHTESPTERTEPPTERTDPPTEPTEASAETVTENTSTEPSRQPTETVTGVTQGGIICDICGLPYTDGEGFEGLCFVCQEKYGPKCSVCGTDCTYRGTIDGMCDDCWEKEQSGECAQCGQQCVGTWVGVYYVCNTCVQMQPCPLCGKYYYVWEMFEGVCFDCDDPSGGAAGEWDGMCIVCGGSPGDYDGYCYYCHPDFGFTCGACGNEWPAHRTESGLCPNCEIGFVCCDLCRVWFIGSETVDGLCRECYVNQSEQE